MSTNSMKGVCVAGKGTDKPSAPLTAPIAETRADFQAVPPYRVILHNDDVTPMDFVVETLLRHFTSDRKHAVEVMMNAHNHGTALVAIMPLEHAEFKVERAHASARAQGFPLTFSIEPAG